MSEKTDILVLRAAFLATLDGHIMLPCYPYFKTPTQWKTWGESEWSQFMRVTKEHTRVDLIYWMHKSKAIVSKWDDSYDDLWAEVAHRYYKHHRGDFNV